MKYRPEIDGLRAFAVGPVILYHAGVPGFGGGFLGVDFFFVISGFLITSILIADLEDGRFSLWDFYERRCRRILPALFVMIFATLIAGYLLLLPSYFEELAESAIAAVLFVSNIYFWVTTDYFAVDVDLKPLLHTWSLAVEEQYYLFFPLFLMLFWRMGRRVVLVLIGVVFVVSLALSQLVAESHATANFYLLPTRAWELLAGAACAFFRNGRAEAGNTWLAWLGLALMVGSVAGYSEAMALPSVLSLPAVIGPALVLLYARQGNVVGKALAWRPLVWIGLVSYSAYLWHQPVFAIMRARLSGSDTMPFIVAAVALTFVLAWLSYRYVERPFRRRGPTATVSNRQLVWILGTGATALLGIAALGLVELGQGRYQLRPLPDMRAFVDVEDARRATWRAYARNPKLATEMAAFPEGTSANVLVVGDSHAKDLFNSLYANADRFPGTVFRVRFFNEGCMSAARGTAPETRACLTEFASEHARVVDQATHVLFSMRWTNQREDALNVILPEAVAVFRERGLKVGIASSSVEYAPEAPFLYAKLYRASRLDAENAARLFFDSQVQGVALVNALLAEQALQLDVPFLRKDAYLCDASAGVCPALTADGDAAYLDAHHYSLTGAQMFGARLAERAWLAPLLER